MGTKSPTIKRILREAAELENAPSPDFYAQPLETDLFEWHFTIRGTQDSPYSEGVYHGRIVLPPSYPLRPPAFRFSTPSGRFEVNREICLSISGHHEETWQPAWGIRMAVIALRTFMETDAKGQLGGLDTPEHIRRRLAQESKSWRCSACGKTNADIIQACEERAKELGEPSAEETLPPELKMGWRDEMSMKTPAQSGPASRDEEDTEEAAVAEGFVQTAPDPPPQPAAAEAVPRPTPTTQIPAAERLRQEEQAREAPAPLPLPFPEQPNQLQQAFLGQFRGVQDDGIPLWLDRAIVAVALLLIALIMRVFFFT